jgi:hypothetical protein
VTAAAGARHVTATQRVGITHQACDLVVDVFRRIHGSKSQVVERKSILPPFATQFMKIFLMQRGEVVSALRTSAKGG